VDLEARIQRETQSTADSSRPQEVTGTSGQHLPFGTELLLSAENSESEKQLLGFRQHLGSSEGNTRVYITSLATSEIARVLLSLIRTKRTMGDMQIY
jgi:hypothetical protein